MLSISIVEENLDTTPLVREKEIISTNESTFVAFSQSSEQEDHIETSVETQNIDKYKTFLQTSWEILADMEETNNLYDEDANLEADCLSFQLALSKIPK